MSSESARHPHESIATALLGDRIRWTETATWTCNEWWARGFRGRLLSVVDLATCGVGNPEEIRWVVATPPLGFLHQKPVSCRVDVPRELQSEAHAVRARDGLRLDAERTHPYEPRSRLLLVHGYAEHQGRYRHVVDRLAEAGCDVWSFDLRGHGRSEGQRGFVDRFSRYLDDVDTMLSHLEAKTRPASTPILLLGHSLGGLISLVHSTNRTSAVAGVAVTSPFLAPAANLPPGAGHAAKLAGWLAPRRDLWLSLDRDDITRDPGVLEAHRNDPLVFSAVNIRWAAEVFKAQGDLADAAPELTIPVSFQLAGDDRIADTKASVRIFERIGSADKTIQVYPGLFHEVLNEPERERVLADLQSWIVRHSD